MKSETTQRRLTLSATVVFIAAIGVGLALVRPAVKALGPRPMVFSNFAEAAVFYGLLYATPLVFACSVATLALSLRPPRPARRQLARRPGFVANAASILGVFVSLVPYIGQTVLDPSRASDIYMHVLSTGLPGNLGFYVIGAMLPLMLGGKYGPYPAWEDRLGWLIGMLWIIMSLLTYSRFSSSCSSSNRRVPRVEPDECVRPRSQGTGRVRPVAPAPTGLSAELGPQVNRRRT